MADITITEGDTLEVDYSLENTGNGTGTFDPRLLVQGVQEDQDTGITLDPAQTATGTLQWPTVDGDAVTDALAEAVTDDTSDSITVTVEGIPDSAIHQYLYEDFNSSEWLDSIGSLDIDTINNLTADESAFSNSGGVTGGVSDYGQSPPIQYLNNNLYSEWAVVFGVSLTDDNGAILGSKESSFDNFIQVAVGVDGPSDQLEVSRRIDGTGLQQVTSSVINDGGDYVALVQSVGDGASDLEIYFNKTTDASSIVTDDGAVPNQSVSLTDMTYYALGDGSGGTERGLSLSMTRPIWSDAAFTTESARESVFNLYDWYDPSTDAP